LTAQTTDKFGFAVYLLQSTILAWQFNAIAGDGYLIVQPECSRIGRQRLVQLGLWEACTHTQMPNPKLP
jgi:hypothetical protein